MVTLEGFFPPSEVKMSEKSESILTWEECQKW
jgi:hypothetical protein